MSVGRFIHVKRSWYASSVIGPPVNPNISDEVNIIVGDDSDRGGYEFFITWYNLDRRESPSPRIKIFNDAWRVFKEVPELFEMLGEYEDPTVKYLTPEKLCSELLDMGFKDATEEKRL